LLNNVSSSKEFPITIKQFILDRVRVMNKYVTNRILIHIAGKKFGHFAILRHIGRKSGTVYQTPIIAEPVEGGFVIALTYGKKVDWLSNILAKGTCSLYWKAKDYELHQPELIDCETGLNAFPSPLNRILEKAGIEYFLRLSIA
jgi:deazaflavin-dependent oxidoreductase (nitroreductase family)